MAKLPGLRRRYASSYGEYERPAGIDEETQRENDAYDRAMSQKEDEAMERLAEKRAQRRRQGGKVSGSKTQKRMDRSCN
jgi:hypothetical protein